MNENEWTNDHVETIYNFFKTLIKLLLYSEQQGLFLVLPRRVLI